MALIKCEECGQMVSDKAMKCPKCGCPVTRRPAETMPSPTPTAKKQPTAQPQQAAQPQSATQRRPTRAETQKREAPQRTRRGQARDTSGLTAVLWTVVLLMVAVCIGILCWKLFFAKHGAEIADTLDTVSSASVSEDASGVEYDDYCAVDTMPGELPKPSYTDLEMLGFDQGIRRIHIWTESELSWEYHFDEKGMITKCEHIDDCGNVADVFDGDKLVSSTAICYEEMGSDDADIFIYKFSYKEENKTHSIVYKTKDGSDEKTKFADIFYDDEGRITSIEREWGNKHEKVKITYREDNMPINDKGKTTVAKLELLGMPIINSNDFHVERAEDGQEYIWNPNEMLTLEIFNQ